MNASQLSTVSKVLFPQTLSKHHCFHSKSLKKHIPHQTKTLMGPRHRSQIKHANKQTNKKPQKEKNNRSSRSDGAARNRRRSDFRAVCLSLGSRPHWRDPASPTTLTRALTRPRSFHIFSRPRPLASFTPTSLHHPPPLLSPPPPYPRRLHSLLISGGHSRLHSCVHLGKKLFFFYFLFWRIIS